MSVPPDNVLLPYLSDLRSQQPELGVTKLLTLTKQQHPEWAISEKRLRKSLQSLKPKRDSHETALIAKTGIDHSLDVVKLAPKVKVRLFDDIRGKGLVAREGLQQGEVIWQEDPWITTADPNMYPYLQSGRMCVHCLALFDEPRPPMSTSCPHCDTARFCNRLCLSRARQSASHHELLCPGQNPGAAALLFHIQQQGARHLDAVAKIVARWRGERDSDEPSLAAATASRVWQGMARVNQETKEKERREWNMVAETRLREWRNAHSLLRAALNPQPHEPHYRQFQMLLTRRSKITAPIPLSDDEVERWFSFTSFLDLLGLAGINQEGSGGLYSLHAHLNHSCEPNVQVRLCEVHADDAGAKSAEDFCPLRLPSSPIAPSQCAGR